jgi:hypothetical protein
MNSARRNTIDSAVGYLLALLAIVFGFIGWIADLNAYTTSNIWFISAGILGILAVGIVLDEGRVYAYSDRERPGFALSWLLMLLGLGCGIVGFVAGMIGNPTTMTWLVSGVIASLISVGVMADEGRRLRAATHGVADEVIGGLLCVAGLAIGVVGFLLGITMHMHSLAWLFGGVIVSIAAVAFMFDGERRAAAATQGSLARSELAG